MANTTLWKDFPIEQKEVGLFLIATNTMSGYPDGTFRPYDTITEEQVLRVILRTGIRKDLREEDFNPVTAKMGWTETNFLPGTVLSAKPEEDCTRLRLGIMLSRYRNADGSFKTGPNTKVVPSPLPVDKDYLIGEKINKWFDETYVSGFHSRLVGMGHIFVTDSRKYDIPLGLALGQCYRESQFGTTGLSKKYNMFWGIKDSKGKWGKMAGHVGSGYTNYINIEESIHAYFRLMSSPLYKPMIDVGNIHGALNKFSPAFENNTSEHYQIVMSVWKKATVRGIK